MARVVGSAVGSADGDAAGGDDAIGPDGAASGCAVGGTLGDAAGELDPGPTAETVNGASNAHTSSAV